MYTNKELYQIIDEQAELWGLELSKEAREMIFAKIAFSDHPFADASSEFLKISINSQ